MQYVFTGLPELAKYLSDVAAEMRNKATNKSASIQSGLLSHAAGLEQAAHIVRSCRFEKDDAAA